MEQLETWLSAARVPLEFSHQSSACSRTLAQANFLALCFPHTHTNRAHTVHAHDTNDGAQSSVS